MSSEVLDQGGSLPRTERGFRTLRVRLMKSSFMTCTLAHRNLDSHSPEMRTLAVCRRGRYYGRRGLVPLLRWARVLFEGLVYLARVRLVV